MYMMRTYHLSSAGLELIRGDLGRTPKSDGYGEG
jgi:hypothetical protein